jgi:hypothetical protein
LVKFHSNYLNEIFNYIAHFCMKSPLYFVHFCLHVNFSSLRFSYQATAIQ